MTTDERFRALETSLRRQRIFITALTLMGVAAVLMAAAPQDRDVEFTTVTTRALVIAGAPGDNYRK